MAKYNNRNTRGYGLGTPLPLLYNRPIEAQRDPTTNDKGYDIGQIWINQTSNAVYIHTNSGIWTTIS